MTEQQQARWHFELLNEGGSGQIGAVIDEHNNAVITGYNHEALRLAACAPDLLAACEAFMNAVLSNEMNAAGRLAEAAIAKAYGEAVSA